MTELPMNTKAQQRAVLGALIEACEDMLTVLRTLEAHMHNRRIQRRRPKTSPPVDLVRDKIKQLHRSNPGMTQHEIAAAVGINSGRVNEVLNGVRR